MAIKKGDIVYIDYIGYIVETNEMFDTTIENEAKKAGIFRSDHRYEPVVVAIGEKWVIEGIEESLIGKEEGQEYEIQVPPEKGYGERDPKKIKIITEKRLRDMNVRGEIAPGNVIIVNGTPAIVRVVSGGRVLLDFNPPLAGKTLRYKIFVRKICKSVKEKIEALISRHSKDFLELSKIKFSEKTKVVEIKLNSSTLDKPALHVVKRSIASDILKLIDKVEKVRFIEEVVKESVGSRQQG